MLFDKKQGRFLSDVIDEWERSGVVGADTAGALRKSYAVRAFDWNRLAKYSFVIAVVCGVIAFAALAADNYLVRLVEKYVLRFVEMFFASSDSVLSCAFAAMAAVVFFAGFGMRRRRPERVFTNETVLFVGVLLAASAIAFLGRALEQDGGRFPLLFGLAAVVYGIIGLACRSRMVWVFSLLSLGSWFGVQTGYASGWGAYYLGMNYPLRFVAFGFALVLLAFAAKHGKSLAFFHPTTLATGLLYLFVSLWILSIFGNYGDPENWRASRTTDLLPWVALFGVAALAAIWHGLKYDDRTTRGFGLTFLFINLYTRYFEYFWNHMHKALFFFILAVSFWLIGRKAEAIWNLELIGKKGAPGDGVFSERE